MRFDAFRYIAAWALLVFLVGGCATTTPSSRVSQSFPLIPQPALVEPKPGTFRLRDGATLIVDSRNAEAAGIAKQFADLLAETRGIHLDVRPFGSGAERDAIIFSLDARAANVPSGEGYDLAVDPQRILLIAREPRGLFYGSVTLWQLLTADTAKVSRLDVPQVHIADHPRFAWRGAMLDSARHFQSPEFVKRFIDELALLKLDTLHWHLTDDQGWRIEIKRYPKLTDVGAWRRPAGAAGTDASGLPVRYGGFYTQDEIRDVVRYAAARYVTIVPEIDMPGHMQAAIAAYPELGSIGDTPVVSPDWGVHTYLVNTDDTTIAFLENVLDEVSDLFPGPYIHIGGDEAVKDQWKASPRVQARMRALGITDENKMQGWLIAQIENHLAKRGKRVIGWDEVLESGVPPNAIVMSWRGAKGGVEAAHAGHDVVMAPDPDLYFDHLQIDEPDVPGRPSLRTLADIYAYEPVPSDMPPDVASHVLGAQAELWTEHMRTEQRVEHAAFPRLDALAEVLWSPEEARDWNSFIARLAPEIERQRALGVRVADTTPRSAHADPLARASSELRPCSGKLRLRLEDDAPANGPRAVFDTDLFDPCWIFEHAPLDGIGGIAVDVGQIPYNFQLAHDVTGIVPRPAPTSPNGELLVKLDGCNGTPLATIPLDGAIANPAITTLSASWQPIAGAHDLCFVFAYRGHDPLWSIDRIRLVPAH
ncbi:MAG TPA: family 20 glycosylhydrolase [Rhodanobacteraceae bacterium]|nr:family 20 glycosylhydrolase [Rhodanobacteraceae bacterium]